jgi:hypothetical protein
MPHGASGRLKGESGKGTKMTRDDFVFSIGFDGSSAIVDRRAKSQYSALTTRELFEKGFFRAAFASALWSGKGEEMEFYIGEFNKKAGTLYTRPEDFSHLFGVYKEGIEKTTAL